MFIAENQNTQKITKLIQSDSEKLLAVAFIGSGFSSIINGNVRIICNLTSGATNPFEVKKILKKKNVEIRNNSKLHAKVYIETDNLIVGSANLSTNGVALEEESASWIEASIQTTEKENIRDATIWFNTLWSESDHITQRMLDDAMETFKERRNIRPTNNKSIQSLKDRDIYCVIYKDELSDEAEEIADNILGDYWYENGYGIYEDWHTLPKGTLIDFHLKNGTLNYEGVWIYEGYEVESNGLNIQIVKKHTSKKGELFLNQLKTIVRKEFTQLWPNHKFEDSVVININDIISYS